MTPTRADFAAKPTSQSVGSGRAVVICRASGLANAYVAERLWGRAQRLLLLLLRVLQAQRSICGVPSYCGWARLRGSTCGTRGSSATASPFPCRRGDLRFSVATASPTPSPRTT